MSTTSTTPYIDTIGGRLILLSTAVALASLGAVALMGEGTHVILIACVVPPILIVACLYGLGATLASHPLQALAMLLVLPIAGGPYLALLFQAATAGKGIGIALLALAIYPLIRGAKPAKAKAAAAA